MATILTAALAAAGADLGPGRGLPEQTAWEVGPGYMSLTVTAPDSDTILRALSDAVERRVESSEIGMEQLPE